MGLLDLLTIRLVKHHQRQIRKRQMLSRREIDSLETRLLLTAPTLTDSEQYMLELVNRARANPTAEAARYGIGLNDGIAPGNTISTDAKQPLAPQQQLITAAVLHSQDMLDRDYFSHTTLGAGTTFDQRVTNQGYVWNFVAENIGYAAKSATESQTVFINEIHEGLFRSPGHRENIMVPDFEEVGIGARLGAFKPPNNPTTFQFTEMVTQNFGSRNLNPYITGVIYTDTDGNDFYTIGESIRGGTVRAVNVTSGAVFSDTIGVSGAYGLVVPAGTYNVTATVTLSGTSRTYQASGNVVVGADNVKVDFETNSATLVSNTLTIESTVNSASETGVTTILFTVIRNGSTASGLTVNLESSDTTEITVPPTVLIPAGHASATFTASAVNDSVIDGNQTATVTVAASGLTSASRDVTVVDRTVPQLPSAIQRVATSRPTFNWTSLSNAATYEIWVNNTTTGQARVVNTAGITTNSYSTAIDLPIGSYSVWVRGFTSLGLASGWSPVAVWQLRPTTTIAGSGRTEVGSSFTIAWDSIPGAFRYDVWIDRQTSSTSQYLRNANVAGNSLVVSNFEIGSYKIWVRARNSAGDYSDWSPAALIHVNYAPSTLAVDATGLSTTPTLSWSSVTGALQYDVWINNLTSGTSAAIRDVAVTGTSLLLSSATAGSYRAWVRARDLNGSSYAWSSPFDFEVGRAPRMSSPSGSGQPARPAFNWTTVAGATRYEIWLTNLTTGLRELSEANLTTTSYTSPIDLASGTSYRVWIRAFDAAGTRSAWSSPLTFNVASDLSTIPELRQLPPSGSDFALDGLFATAAAWLYEPESSANARAAAKAMAPVDETKPSGGEHFGRRYAATEIKTASFQTSTEIVSRSAFMGTSGAYEEIDTFSGR